MCHFFHVVNITLLNAHENLSARVRLMLVILVLNLTSFDSKNNVYRLEKNFTFLLTSFGDL